jgi:predicted glycoside hydrolase/deacetylase ChbG (UPF0249 family)
MRVILHSDDLGITSQVTEHILKAWRDGVLDGFSIIANGNAINQIPDALHSTPELKARISVHFNLTEGCSSAPSAQIPLLVDADGQLRHTFGSLFLNVVFSSPAKRRELFRQITIECAAQIATVRSLCAGRAVTAVDGHNHIHMIPGVFMAVAYAANAACIPEIRISSEPFFMENPKRDWLQLSWWINLIKHLLLRTFSTSAFRVARQFGLHAPEAIIGVLYSGKMSSARALSGIEAAVAAVEIEVLLHIGRASADEAARWKNQTYAAFHLSKSRDVERAEIYLLAKHIHSKDRSATA